MTTKTKAEVSSEEFMNVLTHLISAASAYAEYTGNSEKAGKRDALFKTRLADFNKAIERGRKAYRENFLVKE